MAAKPRSRIRLSALAVVAIAIGALASAAGASAKTLGSVAPPGLGGCTDCDFFQLTTGMGAPNYRVPKGPTGRWTITAWSAMGGASADGQARLRVYRPTATAGQFKFVKQSALETVPPNTAPVFTTSLNVKKGDNLGLGTVDNLTPAYPAVLANNLTASVGCSPVRGQLIGTGTSCPLGNFADHLINVSADLTPR